MPTLTPAINGSNEIDLAGNTYAILNEADTYFEGRAGGQAWLDADVGEREQSLLTAISILDSQRWIGGLVREDQPLAWPRVAIRPMERRSRRLIRTGFETLLGATAGLYDHKNRFWASTAIPTPIKNAQCELAFAILVSDFNYEGEAEVKSFSDDKMSVTFDRPRDRSELPMFVRRFLSPLIMSGPELRRG
jgi:hypothetical protein